MSMPSSRRSLKSPETQLIGDLFGLKRDLESVVAFCQRLLAAFDATPVDRDLLDALSTACVVRYCRCFEGGVRAKLARDNVQNFAPRFLVLHDYFFTLRQKHLVHAVNEFEANEVAVVVSKAPSPRTVLDVAIVGGRVAGLDRETAANFKLLAAKLLDAVATDLEAQEQRLLDSLKSRPIAKLYELPEAPPFAPSWTRAATKRRRSDS